ncbi:MAG: 50S ribosomal protein L11 methyltransferase [Owenweeksia sp.]|nr:50S ribosomal protein L11 methyltransferase [Owenweeksia sp.]
MKDYLEIDFYIEPVEGRDILLALLDNLGYDSFQETDEGLKAYVLEADFNSDELEELFLFQSDDFTISYQVDQLENKNWNEEWETHYAPISIEDKVYIRASFHQPQPQYPMEILITPKMSFGTGHHQTTRLMTRLLLPMDLKEKTVLDMGTGTGILAIVAEKLGAKSIMAIDNFEWAVENTIENAAQNNCTRIEAELGDATSLKSKRCQVVIANINRNVLLEDMKAYVDTLAQGGQLLLSGFFEEDFALINNKAMECGAKLITKVSENKWVACRYEIY